MRGVIPTVPTLITGPTREPLDLEEVKKHIKFSPTTEDTLIDGWIAGARETFEQEACVQIMTATYQLALPLGPGAREIELPYPPLQSIVSVTYDDANGDAQTWDAANYEMVPSGAGCTRGRLALASSVTSWPTTNGQPSSLRIRFVAGFGNATGDVPQRIKDALYLLVSHFHRNRSEVQDGPVVLLPIGAVSTIRSYKYRALPILEPRSWV